MCGRTACSRGRDDLCHACAKVIGDRSTVHWHSAPDGHTYTPSYNLCPTNYCPVLYSHPHEQHYTIQPMRWGLVPSWYKERPEAMQYKTVNCRAESLLEKKTYATPLHKGLRCAVLVDGFYEWHTTSKGAPKQPYFFHNNVHDSEPGLLMLAAVYDVNTHQSVSDWLYSYSVVTVAASDTVKWCHDRMPAILQSYEDVDLWLNHSHAEKAIEALRSTDKIQFHRVSLAVNNANNKGPDCVRPVLKTSPSKSPTSNKMKLQSDLTSFFKKTDCCSPEKKIKVG